MEDTFAEILNMLLVIPVHLFLGTMLKLFGPANFS